ncbi:hypothetical protein [Desulfobacca acetoxidans]|uniref:Uncharacterized protein n=1 Tax=Desulfobacca acetoxidans (strain ATCC 700848 / DSM 11109 / ASRB2) TaxID=880072 RepID=F2NJN5_DESAR|nr:hypothetical protein [Desulfobacca acetoxidans]AEB09690.1 hypothetical protein Desac_1852 [Desulfobacca acetoxidans DSM 11109]
MWPMLASGAEVYLRSGYLYAPLLFDPEIEQEISTMTAAKTRELISGECLLSVDGGYFVKTICLPSLVENYPAVFPEEYEKLRQHQLQGLLPVRPDYRPPLDAKLEVMLFEILPHFLRKRREIRCQKADWGTVLDLLAARIPSRNINPTLVNRLRLTEASLRKWLNRLEGLVNHPCLPPEGLQRGIALQQWFQAALQAHILTEEVNRWHSTLKELQRLLALPQRLLAVLLTIAKRGALEVDGFGFTRLKDPREYLIYKRTGAYALKDYFGRLYLFPDCRVGVSTAGLIYPRVLGMYKHPLLRRYSSQQPICLTEYKAEGEFSAAAVIKALEEGINALFYGYNHRKRNGYNSLDKFALHHSMVDFDDLRIPKDHPSLVAGEVEVKNDFY